MFMDLIRSRRSIRHYEDRPVEDEKIDLLVEAALRSPSSRGYNPWTFVVVREQKTLADLAQAKPHGATFLAKAPLAIAADDLEQMAELTQKAKAKGVEDMILAFGGEKPGDTLRSLTMARRAALRKNCRPLGYPAMVEVDSKAHLESVERLEARDFIAVSNL